MTSRILTSMLGLLFALDSSHGQIDFASAARSAKSDLERAQASLAEQREAIAKERIPLATEYNALLAELTEYRQQAETVRRTRENAAFDLGALERRVQSRRDEDQYVSGLLDDYTQQFESSVTLAELPRYQDAIISARELHGLPPTQRLEKQLAMIQTGIDRLEGLLGGEKFEEKILSREGEVLTGNFAVFGPVAIFAADDGNYHGLAINGKNLRPTLQHPISMAETRAIQSVMQGNEAPISIDVTMGTALELATSRDSLWQHVRKGGFWVIPILVLGIISCLSAFAKWRQLRSIKPLTSDALKSVLDSLRAGANDEALQQARALPHPANQLLERAIQHVDESKELVEEIIYESWLEAQPALQKGLPVLSVTAATAPLLGLLGTVTGMITTFGLINVFGTGDAQSLSGGISEALITTEIGLVVAIPALLAHAYFNRRVQFIIAAMEKAGLTFLNCLPLKPLPPSHA